jgi:putrescine transport system permease protein
VTPEINAISTILIGIVTFGVISASLINRSQTRRREREQAAAIARA